MFKFLRKLVIGGSILVVVVAAYLYFRNPVHQRNVVQTAQRIRSEIKEDKQAVWTGTVVVADVLQGDWLVVNTEQSKGVTVRLAAVDAPEMPERFKRNGQPLAEESRDLLAELVKGKAVQMSIVGTDPAKRPLVLLDLDGTNVNAVMAQAGLAEAGAEGTQALPTRVRHEIENAEFDARQRRTNIWGLENYVRPIEHRIRLQDKGAVTSQQ